jgi:hypothetical protein
MAFARGFAFETPTAAGTLIFFCMDAGRRRLAIDDLNNLLTRYPLETTNNCAAVLLSTFQGDGESYYADYMSATTSTDVSAGAVLAEAKTLFERAVEPGAVKTFHYADGAFFPSRTAVLSGNTVEALKEAVKCAFDQYQRLLLLPGAN